MQANDLLRAAVEGAQAQHLVMETRSSACADKLRLEGTLQTGGRTNWLALFPSRGALYSSPTPLSAGEEVGDRRNSYTFP